MCYDGEYEEYICEIKNYSFTEQNIKWLEVIALELKNVANELHKINELQEKE